jgi:hypothetical protein
VNQPANTKEARGSFLKKRTKKLFRPAPAADGQTGKVFLLLFVHKKKNPSYR